jgi:hypothetical protein
VKLDLLGDLLQILREHGLVRTDLDLDSQRLLATSVQAGFYLARPVLGQLGDDHDDRATADLLAHALREALHTPGPPDPEVLAALAPKVTALITDFHDALAATVHGHEPRN